MARPRTVRTPDGGEVIMKNVSPELADRIKELVTGKVREVVSSAVEEVEPSAKASEYKSRAIGTCVTEGVYATVILGFDVDTNEAEILSVDKLNSMDRPSAVAGFKIAADRSGLV